ncbi:BTAD domain-containing putative transcriptional regulator [Mycolicibacterium chubuense]
MLGLHGGAVVPGDTLVELLWGMDPPRTAAKALQTHISALRRALGDGFVLTQGMGWTVNTPDIDAVRYGTAAARGREAMAAGDVGHAVSCFDEALRLWRGAPELPDSRRGSAERTRWTEGHAALVEDRADALLATGRAAELIGELEAAIAEAPLRERRWGQLMLALYRAGRQGEALAAYQRVRALLADELGVDPGPELRRLESKIVVQDESLELPVYQNVSSVMRAVTFLLTDIEGSTAAWERDSDAMAVALARHDEIVEQVVTSRGGRLIKTRGEGDATFSVFDRPSGAAAAAIELQEAIRLEPWALADPMRIRIALHTGEVELRDGDYFGRAVNRAARLRSLAEGGQILCSGATAELVIDSLADDVVLADLGTRQLKNLPRPERVFELRLETPDDSRPPALDVPIERPVMPTVLAGSGPFVGRVGELELLLAGWQTTLDAGARAVLISGEPGVGKTRLAGEWSRRGYEQGAVVLYGRCDEDLGAPYQPFAEALRSLLPCMGSERLRGTRGIEALLPLVPGLLDVLPELAAPPRADPDTERYALFDAVVAVMGAVSASVPVILVLDDLHWAAKPTLLLLRHLLRFGEHTRLQIIGTYRSTDLDRSHPLAAMLADLNRDGTANRLQLGGLEQDDVTAYLVAAGYDDEDLARALASVTGGNPFFLIEALRHVDESGGRWDPNTLPQGVREALTRRLSRLSVETNKALGAAAVVGSRFAVDLIERVLDQDLVDAFDEASTAGIVVEEPGGLYRFNHALVRQSLLAELASVRRMRLHQRIAAALESEPGAGDLLAELAYHYFECAWAGNAAKAVDYCRRAADQAMARLAYEGAADLYDKALHALEELDDDLEDRDQLQGELLIARCEALLAAGDVASAVGAVTQLRRAAGDSRRLAAWGVCFDGELSALTDPERLDEIEASVGEAAATLAELEDAAGEAKAHTVRAGCRARLGRIGDCEAALDQALTAARRARDHRRVNAVLAGAPLAALWGPSAVPRAGGRCLDVVRLLRITTGSPVVEATSTRCQAVLDAFRGRADAGRQLIESARRSLSELGMRHALMEVEQFAGIIELVADEPAAAEQHLRRAYRGFRRMGLDADAAETAALLARACLALDRDAEADELCSQSQRLAGHALKASISWRTVRAQLLARGGAHEEARRVGEEAVAIAGATDALVDHGDACLALAVVLGIAGDATASRAAAERAADLYEMKGAAALAEKARRLHGGRGASTLATASEAADVRPENARFDPHRPSPRLDNAASRVDARFQSCFANRDWVSMAELLDDDLFADDRRHIVNAGVRRGRDAKVADMRATAELGTHTAASTVIAVRGERLALVRIRLSGRDQRPEAFCTEMLGVVEVNRENRMTARVLFDIDDRDDAFAELDARYAAGEASAHTEAWTIIVEGCAFLKIHGTWPITADFVGVDHRSGATSAPEDMKAYVRESALDTPGIEMYVEAVHRLSDCAAVITTVTTGSSPQGFEAEWRSIGVILFEGRLIARTEVFDESDLEEALARFAELSRPQRSLENEATRCYQRFNACMVTGDREGLAATLADDFVADDARRVVGSGRVGRDAAIKHVRVLADLGVTEATSTILATRGGRLALVRAHFGGRDVRPDAFSTEVLHLAEVGESGEMTGFAAFEVDDLDAAIVELDARYLAGEAAPFARAWSVIAGAYAAFNRREVAPTSPGWSNVDHRRAAAFASGEMTAYLSAAWADSPDTRIYVEAVHRLTEAGAVVTHAARGTSNAGFEAEWRDVNMLTVEGDLVTRSELFDADDLDSAIARFDELTPGTPLLRSETSRWAERFRQNFVLRDWEAIGTMLADGFTLDDRRRTVNGGIRRGRQAEVHGLQTAADVGFDDLAWVEIATRGNHLALLRVEWFDSRHSGATFRAEWLGIAEIHADGRLSALVMFDLDDFDAAIAELDARYLAGEAAPFARTFSVVAQGFSARHRREVSPTTIHFADVDHRSGAGLRSGDLKAYLAVALQDTENNRLYVETVHRLNERGAVITHVATGFSPEGVGLEWRMVDLLTVEGDLFDRCEMFDEDDVDMALARFDEVTGAMGEIHNTASRTYERWLAMYRAHDWNAMSALLVEEHVHHDRRRVVNGGVQRGRDSMIADIRAIAAVGVTNFEPRVIATRGDHLVLFSQRVSGGAGPDAFGFEVLNVVEVNSGGRIVRGDAFDPDDFDAALTELDARFVAGEAAAHATVWTAITQAVPLTTYIEAVHRLSDLGAVYTSVARDPVGQTTSRKVCTSIVRGDTVLCSNRFEEPDVGSALAHFDELSASCGDNRASRLFQRYNACLVEGDWEGMTEISAADIYTDDRRRVVSDGVRRGLDAQTASMRAAADVGVRNAECRVIATRGQQLALMYTRVSGDQRQDAFGLELLIVCEIDEHDRCQAGVLFDPDDVDAALFELDARFMTGEGAPYADIWSLVTQTYAAFNRKELSKTTPDWVNIDHRLGVGSAIGEMNTYVSAMWEVVPDVRTRIVAVHRLSDLGAVFTHTERGTSGQGFEAEWREVALLTFDGDAINRCELFDERDLDTALARFDELGGRTAAQNLASRTVERFVKSFRCRDLDAVTDVIHSGFTLDDRRRVVGAGFREGRDAEIEDLRAFTELGLTDVTFTVVATRGRLLVLSRTSLRQRDVDSNQVHTDMLALTEVDDRGRMTATVIFEVDDLDAAYAELDARYAAELHGE